MSTLKSSFVTAGSPGIPHALLGPRDTALFFFVRVQHLRIGIHDDETGGPVDDDIIVGPDQTGNILQPDDGGNLNGTGHDRRMGCPAADIRGKSQDLVDHHLRRIGRRKIGGDDNDLLFWRKDLFLFLAGKIPQDHVPHISHIAEPFPEVLILHLIEDFPVFIDGHPDCPFGIDGHVPNLLDDVVDK